MMIRILMALVALFGLWVFTLPARADIQTGQAAPAFQLLDQEQKMHSLADYSGKWLVVYFYPKDDTPGCTTEVCTFRDDIFKLHELGAEVVGVSVDNTDSHKKFAEKFSVPFPLLADEGGKVAERYGSLTSMGPIKFASRNTFIINPQGKIAKIYLGVKPEKHSTEVIADIKALQAP